MTDDELRALQQRLDRDTAQRDASAQARNDAIRAELAAGRPQRSIAAALGVSPAVVQKIAGRTQATR